MNLTNPFSTPTTPGVAGPAQAGQPVIYDPATGLYVNQATGAVSTDPAGQHPVANPSLATQAARNISVSNSLMSKLAGYGQQFGQAFGGQTGVVNDLNKTISGAVPSVAQTQLQTGLGQIRSAENSMAAGSTGADAALARTNAALGSADAMSKENQADAGLRAQEVQAATAEKAAVLGQQAGEASGMYGTNLAGATTASGQALQAEQPKEATDQKARTDQNQLELNLLNGAGQAIAISDEREKTDKHEYDDEDMEKLLSKLAAYGFQYKHPGATGEPAGNRVGVMAQDVKKGGPIGKSMVVGNKPMMLDIPNAVGAALAAVGWLKKQIDEQRKGA